MPQKKETEEQNKNIEVETEVIESANDVTDVEQQEVDIDDAFIADIITSDTEENEENDTEKIEVEKEVIEVVSSNDYIDDGVDTAEAVEEAATIIKEVPKRIEGRFTKVGKSFTTMSLPDTYTHTQQQKWSELYSYKSMAKPLIAMLCKVTVIERHTVAYFKILGYEEFVAIVPFEYIGFGSGNLKVEEQKILLEKNIGTVCHIVITEMANGTIFANKIYAEYLLRRKNYYRGRRDTVKTNRYRVIGKGSIVTDAIIQDVQRNCLYLDICGAHCRLPASEVQYLRIANLNEKYDVGKKIRVKILDVKCLNDEALNVRVEASIKQLTEDTTIEALEKAKINDHELATVTNINNERGTIMLATASGYNAIATYVQKKAPVRMDSQVVFQLTKKEKNIGVGIITKVISFFGKDNDKIFKSIN